MASIIVNGKEQKMPESKALKDVAVLYGGIAKGDSFFAKINGKTINSIVDGNEVLVEDGDKIEIFPLVIGG